MLSVRIERYRRQVDFVIRITCRDIHVIHIIPSYYWDNLRAFTESDEFEIIVSEMYRLLNGHDTGSFTNY